MLKARINYVESGREAWDVDIGFSNNIRTRNVTTLNEEAVLIFHVKCVSVGLSKMCKIILCRNYAPPYLKCLKSVLQK